jgi:hypothetical protein
LHELFPKARICVVARQQPRPALGDTGVHGRADVAAAIEALFGEPPEGASLRDIAGAKPAPMTATSPEIIRIAELLGAKVYDVSEYVRMPREECLTLLTEFGPDALLQSIVALVLELTK